MINEAKEYLAFSDVSIPPQYSEVPSRSDPNMDLSTRLHEKLTLKLPIISANMKHITGPKMAIEMGRLGGLGILHRDNTTEKAVEDYKEVRTYLDSSYKCGVTVGVQEHDKERFDKLYEAGARVFTIDLAHAHSLNCKKMTEWVHGKNLKDIVLIVGNIATKEAALDLQEWGADILKIGIGPGCFTGEMRVNTDKGKKCIKDIRNGDKVFTHNGVLRKVINTLKYKVNEILLKINNIVCTQKHEFYVINKNDEQMVDEDNIQQYAKWIKAKDLDPDRHLLVEVLDA